MQPLLIELFGHDFSQHRDAARFHEAFFHTPLSIAQLAQAHAVLVRESSGGIPASMRIPSTHPDEKPFAILAMLHGNEPAGMAGILLAMALSSAGLLARDVIGVIGNPLASTQYFAAYAKHSTTRQETRDAYRCGLAEDGTLLPDMNRIPDDFLTRTDETAHTKRARELHAMAQGIWGITDIHSARGDMVCFTDFKHARDLRYSPLRRVLVGLSEAISAHASAAVSVQTFKTILAPMAHIHSHTGIEAGRHEDPHAPSVAASFTLSLLYNLGITPALPHFTGENGMFEQFLVQPKLSYADLLADAPLPADAQIYMARETATGILHAQYEEMEAIAKGQVVAVAEPYGITLRAPRDFSGIFFSKSGALYTQDPAVGPWPLPASAAASTKFCYPCDVSAWEMGWKN
jgi:hypothetical protein